MSWKFIIVLISIIGFQSLEAQDDNHRFTNDGWLLAESDNSCTALITYEGGTTLSVQADDDWASILVTNVNWSAQEGTTYNIKYDFDEYWFTRYASGIVIGKDEKKAGFIASIDSEFLNEFSKSRGLHLYLGEKDIVGLSLKGSSEAVKFVRLCADRKGYALASDYAKIEEANQNAASDTSRPSTPPANDPFSMAKPPKYRYGQYSVPRPATKIVGGAELSVTAIATISDTGKVVACRIMSSSGFDEVDKTTCDGILQHYKFDPGLGPDGKPAEKTTAVRVEWEFGANGDAK